MMDGVGVCARRIENVKAGFIVFAIMMSLCNHESS